MKQSLLHKTLLTTVNTSGRYVHKKDDYSGYSEQYCYFCKKRPLVLAKYNLKWVTEVDVFFIRKLSKPRSRTNIRSNLVFLSSNIL